MSDEFIASIVDEHEITEESPALSQNQADDGKGLPVRSESDISKLAHQQDSEDHVFEQFKEFFRHSVADYSTPSKAGTILSGGGNSSELGMKQRIEHTQCLWKEDFYRVVSGTNSRETKGTSSMSFEWERALVNTSAAEGIEDWLEQLEEPDVPDNRIKIIFESVCAELKKMELRTQIQTSLMQMDTALSPMIVQLQTNETLRKLCAVKYIVETIEDVLSLLSDPAVEASLQGSLVRTLATAIHDESLGNLLQFSHARNLIVLSLCVLLDNDLKSHVSEAIKTLMFSATCCEGSVLSDERASMLSDIIERCTDTELLWLKEDVLGLYTNCEKSSVSKTCDAVTETLLKKITRLDYRSGKYSQKSMQETVEAISTPKKKLSKVDGNGLKQ